MKPWEAAIQFVLGAEGEHFSDPIGGDTWYGISRRAYPTLTPWPPSKQAAMGILFSDYWAKLSCESLPSPLALVVFDSAVNQGRTAATQMLQSELGVTADGILGPKTLSAAYACDVEAVLAGFLARRAARYALAPMCFRYGLGWMRRLFDVHRTALRLEWRAK